NAIVERRQRQDRSLPLLHEHERRRQAAVPLRTDEVAPRERIPEQHFVVAWIEERRTARGHPSSRDAAKNHRQRLDGPIHFRFSVTLDDAASFGESRSHTAGRPLLAACPGQFAARELEPLFNRPDLECLTRQTVCVLVREHAKTELVAVERDRGLW